MDADLVVLSACDTGGGGKESGGETLSGLARNFFFAGARNLFVSHWDVPSLTTRVLLKDTFKKLFQRRHMANALRESQLAVIRTGQLLALQGVGGFYPGRSRWLMAGKMLYNTETICSRRNRPLSFWARVRSRPGIPIRR